MTGAAGFAGSHLVEYLLAQGLEVHGAVRGNDGVRRLARIAPKATPHRLDLCDADAVRAMVAGAAPARVYHLAAQASVGRGWHDAAGTLANNVTAQLHLLGSLVEAASKARVLVVGSADEYGLVPPSSLPVDEDTPLRPLNPYAVSKIAQDFMGLQYHLSHGLHVVRVRPFNHIGPRQELGFVVPDFARQIAEIEAGRRDPVVRVGNLDAERDLSDVRDVVRAYHLVLEMGAPGEVYNVGAGRAHSIGAVLDMLLAESRVPVRVERDPARMRPSDVPRLVADCGRLQRATGWEPRHDLLTSLRDVLDYWRSRVRSAPEEGDG